VIKSLLVLALVAAVVACDPRSTRVTQEQFDPHSRREVVVPWLAQQPESRVVASKTRAALVLETSVGPVVLWVAPTRGGGGCYLIDIQALPIEGAGAACSPRPVRANYVIRHWLTETRVGDDELQLLGARVTPEVASVEVRFADGTTDAVRPAAGFVLREIRGGEEPVAVVARGEDGSVLRRRPMPGPRAFRRDLAFPIGAYRKLIELETSAGFRMTFAVAPGTNGSVCERTTYRRAATWGCGPGPARLAPDEIDVHPGRWNVLEGSVGRAIRRLEVWYEGGAAARMPVVEQYVLFEVPQQRVPRLLVGIDAEGSVVARRTLR
jgi:hypothetical protein